MICDTFYGAHEKCWKYFGIISWTTFLTPLIFMPPLLVLHFTKKAVYTTWKLFTIITIPIALYIIFVTPQQCSAPLDLCLDREKAAYLFCALFLIFSFFIIAIQSWKLRERTKKSNEYEERREKIDTFTINKSKMDFSDTELIKQAIVSAEGNKSDTEIKKTLLQQGFQEKDITKAFDEIKKDDQKAGK
jgi:hypothetical protein